VVTALLSAHATHSPACGPFFPRAVFTYEAFPQFELEEFAAGKIGVIQPKYWRRFLFAAYRHLSGAPLTEVEREVFVGASRRRR
jgi:hypothetical protein